MTHTATYDYQSAASLKALGAVQSTQDPSTGQFLNYLPKSDQDIAQGNVSLELDHVSKLIVAANAAVTAKPDRKLETMKPLSPAATLQQNGLRQQQRMMRSFGRQPNHYASLNARTPVSPVPTLALTPKPQLTAAPKPVVALPQTMTMQVGQLRKQNQPNRAGLRLVASNAAAPTPTAMPQAPAPSFARRRQPAYNFG